MARIVQRTSPGMRLQLGASVLTAARAVDTRLVEARLATFDRVHQSYVGAQRDVDGAESWLRAAQVRLAEADAILAEAVETLARALVADGEPRANPFETFGAPAPGTVKELLFAEEAATVHQLAAAVQRSKGASAPTIDGAKAADEAARTVEEALGGITALQDGVRDARRMREAIALSWETALVALKYGCRAAAAADGAPDLYATLFPPVVRKPRKRRAEAAANGTETKPAA